MSFDFHRKLPTPAEIKELYPLPESVVRIKEQRDRELKDIFTGKDDRFILIIGPCSADHPDPVLDYTGRLAELQNKVGDKIFIVPRIYTNKPRTTGLGYKGMAHQPSPVEEAGYAGRSDRHSETAY